MITTFSAPGKINIFFKVGSLQQDGYHDVASVYQAVELREQVSIRPAEKWTVTVEGSITDAHLAEVPTDESNLVVKAAKAVAALADITSPHPVSFNIHKAVPVAGGMGGGSADAAAAVLAVNEMWCTGISREKLLQVSASLGADVPFAIMGGTAIGVGRGDVLRAIENVQQLHWVLIPCHVGLSTPAVYKRLDELRAQRGEDPHAMASVEEPSELIDALVRGDLNQISSLIHNDLQEAAIDLMPSLQQTIDAGISAGALVGVVSGSGPTVALLAQSKAHAEAIAEQMTSAGHLALPTWGPSVGAKAESN